MNQIQLPLIVSFPFGLESPLIRAQTLMDVAPLAAVKMVEGDVKGLVRLVEGIGIPPPLRVPAIFQLGVGYGISHGAPLPEADFFRLIGRVFDHQFPVGPGGSPRLYALETKETVLGRLRRIP